MAFFTLKLTKGTYYFTGKTTYYVQFLIIRKNTLYHK